MKKFPKNLHKKLYANYLEYLLNQPEDFIPTLASKGVSVIHSKIDNSLTILPFFKEEFKNNPTAKAFKMLVKSHKKEIIESIYACL